jgi:hypothetical protein
MPILNDGPVASISLPDGRFISTRRTLRGSVAQSFSKINACRRSRTALRRHFSPTARFPSTAGTARPYLRERLSHGAGEFLPLEQRAPMDDYYANVTDRAMTGEQSQPYSGLVLHHVVGPQPAQRRVGIALDLHGRMANAESPPQFRRQIVRTAVLGLAAIDQMRGHRRFGRA